MKKLKVEAILTILVNFAHTLSPNAQELFNAANEEFGNRTRFEFHAMGSISDLYIRPADLIKIMNVLLDHS